MLAAVVITAVVELLLFALVLVVMREAVILRSQVTALSQLIISPPMPSYLQDRLPEPLVCGLAFGDAPKPREAHLAIFLDSGCAGCDQLAAELRQAVALGQVRPSQITFIVSAASEDAETFQKARRTGGRTVLDTTGGLLKAAEVRGTPSQLAFWRDTMVAFDSKLGGDVEWTLHRLDQSRSQHASVGSLQDPVQLIASPQDQRQPAAVS